MTAESHPRSQRLRRLDRIFPRTPIYFVTACTDKRRPLLANDAVHENFQNFADLGQERGAWVGAYVIMPDHLHFFVAFDDREMLLDRWMKSLKNAISKHCARGRCPRRIGRKDFSITSCEVASRMGKNGTTCGKTPCVRGWLRFGASGPTAGQSISWNIGTANDKPSCSGGL